VKQRGFWWIAIAFTIAMLGTILPTPLYPIYERVYGFGPLIETIVFAVYAFGVLAELLFFGHLSDEVGRRPVLIGGLILSALSALLFLFALWLPEIYAGRILSGLAAGAFTGSATAALVDLVPPERRGRAASVAVTANIGGLGLGTLLSGILGQYAPAPLRLSYGVDFILVCLAIVCVFLAPETVANRSRLHVSLQRLRVPPEIRSVFVEAAVLGMSGFAAAGLFCAIAPSVMTSLLHIPNHAYAGVLVFALSAMTAVGQLAVRHFARARALFVSCALLFFGMAILAAALANLSAPLLFASAIVEGLGMGLGIGSGLAAISERISERRAEVTSAYFVLLYLGLAVPVVGLGLLATHGGLRSAGLTFCAFFGAILIAVIVVSTIQGRPRVRAASAVGNQRRSDVP
jgi:MFS family permease